MSKFSRKPKAVPGVEDFIVGAEQRVPAATTAPQKNNTIPSNPEAHPWQHPRVRDDVLKVYNLRLPEPYLLKLRFIAGNTPGSMQRFCLDALLPAIDAEIERLAGGR